MDLRENQWWTSYSATCDLNGFRGPCDFDQTRALGAISELQWGNASFTITQEAALPEPASLTLAGIGMLGLIATSRRTGKVNRKR